MKVLEGIVAESLQKRVVNCVFQVIAKVNTEPSNSRILSMILFLLQGLQMMWFALNPGPLMPMQKTTLGRSILEVFSVFWWLPTWTDSELDSFYPAIGMWAFSLFMSALPVVVFLFACYTWFVEDDLVMGVHAYRPNWPIRMLRFFNSVTPAVYVSVLVSLVSTLSCDDLVSPRWMDSGFTCWTGSHSALVAISVIILPFYVTYSVIMALCAINRKPDPKRNPLSQAHGRVAAAFVLLKTVGVIIFVASFTLNLTVWLPLISSLIMGIAWAILYSRFMPYYVSTWNELHSAMAAVYLAAAVSSIFGQAASADDLRIAPWVFLFVAPTAAPLGYILAKFSLRIIHGRSELSSPFTVELRARIMLADIERDFRHDSQNENTSSVEFRTLKREPSFTNPRDASILRIDEKAARLKDIQNLYEDALASFPSSPMLALFTSTFFRFGKKNRHLEFVHLRSAQQMNDSAAIDIQFFIWERHWLADEEENRANSVRTSVVRRLHFDTLNTESEELSVSSRQLILDFWTEAAVHNPDMAQLKSIGRKVISSISRIESIFLQLMEIAPQSAAVMRQYADFLFEIANNPRKALELIQAAEMIEEDESKARSRSDLDAKDYPFMSYSPEFDLSNENVALIRLSGEPGKLGTLIDANQAALKLFGFAKRDLLGKSIDTVVPPPIDAVHHKFLLAYMKTGIEHVVNTSRYYMGLHRAGYLFPMSCNVRPMDDGFGAVMEEIITSQAFIFFLGASGKWRVTAACKTSMTLLGISPADLRDRSVSMEALLPELTEDVSESDLEPETDDSYHNMGAAKDKARGASELDRHTPYMNEMLNCGEEQGQGMDIRFRVYDWAVMNSLHTRSSKRRSRRRAASGFHNGEGMDATAHSGTGASGRISIARLTSRPPVRLIPANAKLQEAVIPYLNSPVYILRWRTRKEEVEYDDGVSEFGSPRTVGTRGNYTPSPILNNNSNVIANTHANGMTNSMNMNFMSGTNNPLVLNTVNNTPQQTRNSSTLQSMHNNTSRNPNTNNNPLSMDDDDDFLIGGPAFNNISNPNFGTNINGFSNNVRNTQSSTSMDDDDILGQTHSQFTMNGNQRQLSVDESGSMNLPGSVSHNEPSPQKSAFRGTRNISNNSKVVSYNSNVSNERNIHFAGANSTPDSTPALSHNGNNNRARADSASTDAGSMSPGGKSDDDENNPPARFPRRTPKQEQSQEQRRPSISSHQSYPVVTPGKGGRPGADLTESEKIKDPHVIPNPRARSGSYSRPPVAAPRILLEDDSGDDSEFKRKSSNRGGDLEKKEKCSALTESEEDEGGDTKKLPSQVSGSSTGSSTTDVLRAGIEMRAKGTETSLVRLRHSIIFIFLVIALLNVASVIISNVLFSDLLHALKIVGENGNRELALQNIYANSQRLAFIPFGVSDDMALFNLSQTLMQEAINDLSRTHQLLYQSVDNDNAAERALYAVPSIEVKDVVSGTFVDYGNFEYTTRLINLGNAGLEVLAKARSILAKSLGGDHIVSGEGGRNLIWLLTNGPGSLRLAFDRAMIVAQGKSAGKTDTILVVNNVVLIVIVSILVLDFFCIMVPAFLDVMRTKSTVFTVFLDTPINVLRALRAQTDKKIQALRQAQEEADAGLDVAGQGEVDLENFVYDEDHPDAPLVAGNAKVSSGRLASPVAAPTINVITKKKKNAKHRPRRFKRASNIELDSVIAFTVPVLMLAGYFIGIWAWKRQMALDTEFTRAEVYVAYQQQFVLSQLNFHLREAYTSCNYGYIIDNLASFQSLMDKMERQQDWLLYGEPEQKVRSQLQHNQGYFHLMMEDGCINTPLYDLESCHGRGPMPFYDGLVGKGIQGAFKQYLLLVKEAVRERRAVATSNSSCTVSAETYKKIKLVEDLGDWYLGTGFTRAAVLVNQASNSKLETFLGGDIGAMVAVNIVLFLSYFIYFSPIVSKMDRDIKNVRHLLLLFPDDVAKQVPAIVAAGKSLMKSTGFSKVKSSKLLSIA